MTTAALTDLVISSLTSKYYRPYDDDDDDDADDQTAKFCCLQTDEKAVQQEGRSLS